MDEQDLLGTFSFLNSEGYGSGYIPVPTYQSDTEDKNSREQFLVPWFKPFADGCQRLRIWTLAKFDGKFSVLNT